MQIYAAHNCRRRRYVFPLRAYGTTHPKHKPTTLPLNQEETKKKGWWQFWK